MSALRGEHRVVASRRCWGGDAAPPLDHRPKQGAGVGNRAEPHTWLLGFFVTRANGNASPRGSHFHVGLIHVDRQTHRQITDAAVARWLSRLERRLQYATVVGSIPGQGIKNQPIMLQHVESQSYISVCLSVSILPSFLALSKIKKN